VDFCFWKEHNNTCPMGGLQPGDMSLALLYSVTSGSTLLLQIFVYVNGYELLSKVFKAHDSLFPGVNSYIYA